MGRGAALIFLLIACCGCADAAQNTSTAGRTSTYVRSTAQQPLSLQHPVLRRHKSHPHAPEQIHLTIAGPGSISVSWVTHPHEDAALRVPTLRRWRYQLRSRASALMAAAAAAAPWVGRPLQISRSAHCTAKLQAASLKSVVQIGGRSGQYSANVTSSTSMQQCYVAGGYVSGALHHVVVGGGDEGPLGALETYYYRVGDPGLGWSEEFSFTMPRESYQDGGFPYRLGLIGDLGQTANSEQTLRHLAVSGAALVLNVGDLSYADGEQPRWDSYGRLVQASTAALPQMTLEGNHELESIDGAPEDFTAYLARWRMPYQRSGSPSPLFYSYETGPAHIVMLGSYADYGRHSAQVAWMRADLARVDRARTPWLIAAMHAPWYNSNLAHQLEAEDMRSVMEPILYSYGVDLIFAGHVHAYERSERVLNYKRHKCGPVYVVVGDGGNREGLAQDYMPQPTWSSFREASYGFGSLEFEDATSALWRWHRNEDGPSVVADEVRFTRRPGCHGSLATPAVQQQR